MFVGCSSSCGQSNPTNPKKKKPLEFTSFPAVAESFQKLSPSQQDAFARVMNDEACPCNCAKTFAGCLQTGTKCKAAVILADWVANKLGSWSAEDMLLPLMQEIGSGYGSKIRTIDANLGHAKGAERPKVTIVEFADFDCPHCRVTAPVLDEFVKQHKDDVRLVYKYLPRNTLAGQNSAIAAQAAGQQGKFWEMHDALFAMDKITDEKIAEAAKKIPGLKMDQYDKDRADVAIQSEITQSRLEASRLGINATPAIFFNGRPFLLNPDISGLEMRLAMELARNESTCD
jgi:protein-disulfide isomerase